MNLLKKVWNWASSHLGAVAAIGLGVLGLTSTAHATFTDPAADIETALAAAGTGASTTFITIVTIVASAALLGIILFAIRKGVRPR